MLFSHALPRPTTLSYPSPPNSSPTIPPKNHTTHTTPPYSTRTVETSYLSRPLPPFETEYRPHCNDLLPFGMLFSDAYHMPLHGIVFDYAGLVPSPPRNRCGASPERPPANPTIPLDNPSPTFSYLAIRSYPTFPDYLVKLNGSAGLPYLPFLARPLHLSLSCTAPTCPTCLTSSHPAIPCRTRWAEVISVASSTLVCSKRIHWGHSVGKVPTP